MGNDLPTNAKLFYLDANGIKRELKMADGHELQLSNKETPPIDLSGSVSITMQDNGMYENLNRLTNKDTVITAYFKLNLYKQLLIRGLEKLGFKFYFKIGNKEYPAKREGRLWSI